MSKKHVIILIIFLIATAFLLLKPYNQLCRMVNWCSPISFSYLVPNLKGEKSINFKFLAENNYENVDFKVSGGDSVLLRSGSKFTVDYEIINNSLEAVQVRPMRFFSDNNLKEYLHFYECLCFQSYEIQPGKKKLLSMRFLLKKEFDKSDFKDGDLVELGYKMMLE